MHCLDDSAWAGAVENRTWHVARKAETARGWLQCRCLGTAPAGVRAGFGGMESFFSFVGERGSVHVELVEAGCLDLRF